MKLAVINFSGNVGKTTVARHLLAPRIPGCQVVAVESINADDGQPVTIRGRQFAQLQEFLQSVDHVVVDIGASNVEELLKLMRRYRDSQQDFDGFVVPTVPARKRQQDTAATLAELARIGVAPERLRLVFNQVDDDSPIDRAFDTLLAYCASSGVAQYASSVHLVQRGVCAGSGHRSVPARTGGRPHRLQGRDRQGRRPGGQAGAGAAARDPASRPRGHPRTRRVLCRTGSAPPDTAVRRSGDAGIMKPPSTTREALIVEALGEAAKLIRQVEALAPRLDESRQALADAHSGLADQLTAFEAQVLALSEKAKVQTVKHILARTDEAARRSVDLQARAMADAARVAFGAQLGATLQRLEAVLMPLIEGRQRRWERWLTHAAAAATASAATWALTTYLQAG